MKNVEMFAKYGYVGFAADIFGYGQGVLPKDVPEMQAQTTMYNKDRALMKARTQAGYDAWPSIRWSMPARSRRRATASAASTGVELAATGVPLAATITIHGSFPNHQAGLGQEPQGQVLILHGAEDAGYPLTTVADVIDELRAAKVDFQYEVYSGADHGFSVPKSTADQRADTQSRASAGRYLKEVFAGD